MEFNAYVLSFLVGGNAVFALLQGSVPESTRLDQLEAMVKNLTLTLSAEKAKNVALQTSVSGSTLQKQVAFTVCHTLSEHLGDHQAVIYNKIVTNIGNAYDVRDGQFTAPVDGLYTFSYTGMAYQKTYIWLALVKNSVNLVRIYATDGYADSSSTTAHVHLNTGDRVWIRNDSGPNAQLHPGDYNCFSGILQTIG